MAATEKCRGPECNRKAVVDGLCLSHYQQHRRGGPLRPLRSGSGTKITVRLSTPTIRALKKMAKGEQTTVAAAARSVLEEWGRVFKALTPLALALALVWPRSVLAEEHNPWTIHRQVATWGLVGSWALTVMTSLALDDAGAKTTAIPIVGPAVTVLTLENDPRIMWRPHGKALLYTSTIVQSAFLGYLMVSIVGEVNYTPRVALVPGPTPLGAGVALRF